MADGIISAQENALRKGAQAVRTAKGEIDGRIRRIEGDMESLRGAWSGQAAGVYQTLMSRWREEAARLNNVLITLEAAISQTEKDQAAKEEDHQTTISGLTSMMGS